MSRTSRYSVVDAPPRRGPQLESRRVHGRRQEASGCTLPSLPAAGNFTINEEADTRSVTPRALRGVRVKQDLAQRREAILTSEPTVTKGPAKTNLGMQPLNAMLPSLSPTGAKTATQRHIGGRRSGVVPSIASRPLATRKSAALPVPPSLSVLQPISRPSMLPVLGGPSSAKLNSPTTHQGKLCHLVQPADDAEGLGVWSPPLDCNLHSGQIVWADGNSFESVLASDSSSAGGLCQDVDSMLVLTRMPPLPDGFAFMFGVASGGIFAAPSQLEAMKWKAEISFEVES